jgi:trigger factor
MMQVTETRADGLKRELKVVIPQGELGQRFATRLDEVKDQVQLKGFRKGKVPVAHVKKLFGRSLMVEVLQQTVEETSRQAVSDRKERLAGQPSINMTEDKDEIERVLSGQSDLSFSMSYEALPDITIADFSKLELEREVADVADEAVERALADLLERSVRYEAEADRAAVDSDRLTIDFVGSIDGKEFDGGKGEGVELVLGQSSFIPGFAEGLAGAKGGEQRTVNARFPDEYQEKSLAGKDAQFAVTVKEVAKAIKPTLDDEFAKTLGAKSLPELKDLVRARIAAQYADVARMKLKRNILDQLDKAHDFALPQGLVDGEFEGLWRQVTQGLEQAGKTFADEGRNEEETKAEYRKLAAR